jgi:hypothetical protein
LVELPLALVPCYKAGGGGVKEDAKCELKPEEEMGERLVACLRDKSLVITPSFDLTFCYVSRYNNKFKYIPK